MRSIGRIVSRHLSQWRASGVRRSPWRKDWARAQNKVRIVAMLTVVAVVGGIMAIGIAVIPRQPPSLIKIGYAISLTGPNAPGPEVTVLPNYRLWVREVNDAGGILLRSIGKKLPVEIIEHDDESNVDKAVEAVERLITQDKVDFIFSPWGTGLNLAVGPQLHAAGYPHLAVTAMNDDIPELVKRWPSSFWFPSTMSEAARSLVSTLETLHSEGKVSERIAIVSVADQLGIGFAKAARNGLKKTGFEIVYDRSYSVGMLDFRSIIEEAKQLNPDCFLAFSHPSDTMAITEQARESSFNPKVFYTAIGTSYPIYEKRFGGDVNGVMGYSGWGPDTLEIQTYRKRYLEVIGKEPVRGIGPLVYASLQMLQQAIERVGAIDRAAVVKELQTGTFQTVLGQVKMEGNRYSQAWRVGQWQDGMYHGIAPATLPGARPILFPKPAWRSLNTPQLSPSVLPEAGR